MSVYIKGMEMPESCIFCPAMNGDWSICKLTGRNINLATRQTDCPLIPVPDHGDLIDRDKLRETMFIGEQCLYSWDEVEDAIDYAPTIIPADKEEDRNVE